MKVKTIRKLFKSRFHSINYKLGS